jgi:hypothetical protein
MSRAAIRTEAETEPESDAALIERVLAGAGALR